ncbi:MAG: hypothetical protein KY469_15320 [Actinobacteria bacterium]|nr:hypothetical protein [Actinomycetota bacterium]
MASYANRAPRWVTILVALVLTVVGVLGTFVDLLPHTVGIWSYVLATVVLLLGIFLRRL